jgi:hypothetical protein
MRPHSYLRIAFHIVLLFGLPMVATFLSEWLTAVGFFGDAPCHIEGLHNHMGGPCDGLSWGARHYWYVWGCFFLWILGLIRVVVTIAAEVESTEAK